MQLFLLIYIQRGTDSGRFRDFGGRESVLWDGEGSGCVWEGCCDREECARRPVDSGVPVKADDEFLHAVPINQIQKNDLLEK